MSAGCSKGELLEQKIDNVEQNSKNWWEQNQHSMDKLENAIEKLNENIEKLPEKLKNDINENIDLKIENRIKATENKFYKYVIGLGVGLIGAILTIILDKVL